MLSCLRCTLSTHQRQERMFDQEPKPTNHSISDHSIKHCVGADYQPDGKAPPGPSPLRIENGKVLLPDYTTANYPVAHELTKEEIQGIVQEYVVGAKNALEAGCV
jgi:2,4-dienoyl-CoA reductase-like NADH-dependent reductase (Old Yellow Enzyme family)